MRDRFIDLLKETRVQGIDNLIEWLDTTDFFTAPASTQYHGAHEGGLVEHSLAVFGQALELEEAWPVSVLSKSIVLCALLHDVCKIGMYRRGTRNVKVDGKWEQKEVWEYVNDDPFPYGHGEKSVEMISRHIALTDEEKLAIRWHMGPWEDCDKRACSKAMEHPLTLLVHMADMVASKIMERDDDAN